MGAQGIEGIHMDTIFLADTSENPSFSFTKSSCCSFVDGKQFSNTDPPWKWAEKNNHPQWRFMVHWMLV